MKLRYLYFLSLIIPAIFIFRPLFLPGSLAWGDAPYFYQEGLIELFLEPSAWTSRGNNFGGVNQFLWLSPLMLFYGALNKFIGLGNDLIIRLLFYFPSLILATVTPILFVKYLKLPTRVQFFASLFYVFNTYYLLLIDGGVVGVALAYGLFPLTLLYLKKFIDEPNKKTFFASLFVLFAHTVVDPRIVIIAIVTLLIWIVVESIVERKIVLLKRLHLLLLLGLANIALGAYWIIPLFKIERDGLSVGISGVGVPSFLNSLLIFLPHWPNNIFGEISKPPFYFIGVAILIVFGLLYKGKTKLPIVLAVCYTLLVFVAKGGTEPFGQWYSWLINNLALGFAMRDSTKFFIPLTLFGGILIGLAAEKFKGKWTTLIIYIYLLFLVFPAVVGNLNFVLSNRTHSTDLDKIYKNLKKESGFFRTAWFPEQHPLAFQAEEMPALNAKDLVNYRPFTTMNTGSFDKFNFLHNPDFIDWFQALGIRHLIFSGNQRVVGLSNEEQVLWDDLLERTATTSGLIEEDWDTQTPIYSVVETRPQMYAIEHLYTIVGAEPDALDRSPVTSAVYFEDGKLDPNSLNGIDSESASIVFNNKGRLDLKMSFLQEYFLGHTNTTSSDWAHYEAFDSLVWKYQLLIRDIDTNEFDYGKGIAFSTNKDEEIVLDLKVDLAGDYILAIRAMGTGEIEIGFNSEKSTIETDSPNVFRWFTRELSLPPGEHELVIKNNSDISVFNVAALIPKKDWLGADDSTQTFLTHFTTIEPGDIVDQEWSEVEVDKVSPTFYRFIVPDSKYWIVFTDSYHPSWKLQRGVEYFDNLPIYSMVNVFYVEPGWPNTKIVFEGQKQVRWGTYLSAISVLGLAIIFLWTYPRRD